MAAHAVHAVEACSLAQEKFTRLEERLQSGETLGMTHSDLESFIDKEGREVLRQLLQAHLDLRAGAKAAGPVTGADGVERTHHREGERGLETILGSVRVTREGHGARGESTLFPLDAELNLPQELYSFGIRRRAAEEAAKGSYDDAMAVLEKYTGAKVPKRQLEEVVRRAALDFDNFYVNRRTTWTARAKKMGEILVLTYDGKGVAMRHDDLREATKAAASKRNRKLEKRLAKGEKRNTKRMAEVAAVYTSAPFIRQPEDIIGDLRPDETKSVKRPRPEGKRVWASLEKEPREVIEESFQDARSRDPGGKRRWVALVDGNKDQIKQVRAAAKRHGAKVQIVLDVIHVLEYLWDAAYVFHAEGSKEAEAWVTEKLLWLLCGEAGQVVGSIRRSATKRGLSEKERKAADACARYISGHKQYVQYDKYLAAGLPIATGVIEGACRYVVRDRMEITGARWSLEGAEAVLRLRSVRASGDLEEYWRYHERMEKQRNHESLYEDGEPPQLTPPTAPTRIPPRARLRLVK